MILTEILRKLFRLEKPICESCEILKEQLDNSNRERLLLLEKLVPTSHIERTESSETEPIKSRHVPWNVRRQMLEENDRATAVLMREKSSSIPISKMNGNNIASLEAELGIESEVQDDKNSNQAEG